MKGYLEYLYRTRSGALLVMMKDCNDLWLLLCGAGRPILISNHFPRVYIVLKHLTKRYK